MYYILVRGQQVVLTNNGEFLRCDMSGYKMYYFTAKVMVFRKFAPHVYNVQFFKSIKL